MAGWRAASGLAGGQLMDLKKCPLTEEEKQSMIADAALAQSEKKGFAARDPLDGWHAAEDDVEKALSDQCRLKPHQQQTADARVEGWKGRGMRIWHLTANSVKDLMSRRRHT